MLRTHCQRGHEMTDGNITIRHRTNRDDVRRCSTCERAGWRAAKFQKYGMTAEQYEQRLAAQGGRCAICGTDNPGKKHSFVVDHDHVTGNVRGLLCIACNVRLGVIENEDFVDKARRYLCAASII